MDKDMDIEQNKLEALRKMLIEGEESAVCDYSLEELLSELDRENASRINNEPKLQ